MTAVSSGWSKSEIEFLGTWDVTCLVWVAVCAVSPCPVRWASSVKGGWFTVFNGLSLMKDISTQNNLSVTSSCATHCLPDVSSVIGWKRRGLGTSVQNNSSGSQTAVWLAAHQICHFYNRLDEKRIGYIKTEQFISHKHLCDSLLTRYVTSIRELGISRQNSSSVTSICVTRCSPDMTLL